MARDSTLTARLRMATAGLPAVEEKQMMGGVCFMVAGHMLGGARVHKDGVRRFMFRVGPEREPEALDRLGAVRAAMGQRQMKGFVHVDADTLDDDQLAAWVALARDYIATLPPRKVVVK
ncbi:MAG: TfoX/Sxy family protein [Pseudomonadota bacterium]